MAVFWVVAPLTNVSEVHAASIGRAMTHLRDDRDNMGLWNVDELLAKYTALQTERQPFLDLFCRISRLWVV
jgi:hypothetical protein